MKNFIPIALLALTSAVSPLLFAMQSNQQLNHQKISTPVKNIIMVIADGMGPAYTSAYRYYRDDPNTPNIEKNRF
jgi:alkaline phosphatase